MHSNTSNISLNIYSFNFQNTTKKQERFTFYTFINKEFLQWRNDPSFRLLFLRKGTGRIRMKSGQVLHLNENECILIDKADFQAESSCELVVWLLNDRFDPEDRSFFRTLQPQVVSLPFSSQSVMICQPIADFLELLCAYKEDGLIEHDTLYELKQRELFLLFRHYYHPEALAALFYPLLCRLNDFRERILEHFHQVRNTGELIERLGMKRTSFERKFRRHFGTSAHQWLLQQKAVAVRRSLEEGKYSLNEIRSMYGFNSATHFVRFCRKQLGAPPSQLRKDPLSIPLKGETN